MRLRRLDLTRYGKFTGYSIDFGESLGGAPDLHIIYGLNEAGKSTALSGYLDLLFGIEERTRYAFLHQYGTMEVGAVLEFGNSLHELRRVKQRANSLLDARGQPLNEALLSVPLAGLTRDAYRMMFSLDDQTLEDGGNAILESRSDLGELLFSASAGLADVSRTLEAIGTEADRIFRKRASSTQIAGLKRQLADLKTRRDQIDVQASAHAALVTALRQAENAYSEAARERAAARIRHEELGRILRAYPLANEYRRTSDELSTLQHLPRPPGHWVNEFPELMADEAKLQALLKAIDDRAERIRGEIEAAEVDERLLQLGERLDRLSEASARFRTAEDDLPKRRSALAEVDMRIDAIVRALGRDIGVEPETLLIPAHAIGALRDLIEERSGIEAAVKAAEQESADAMFALDRAREDRKSLSEHRLSIDKGRSAAIEAIIARLRQTDLFARQRLAERDLPQRQKRFDDAKAALTPWSGDGADVKALAVPDNRQTEAWRTSLAALESRRSSYRDRLRDLSTQQREQMAQTGAIRETAGDIGDDTAATARAGRDAAWRKHLEHLDRQSAQLFERKMRSVDEMADARVNHAHDLAEMRSLAATLAITAAQLERQKELLSEVDREISGLRDEIRRVFPVEIGMDWSEPAAHLISQIERWVKKWERAAAASEELRIASDTADQTTAEVAGERELLAGALAVTGLGTDGLSLPALVQAAETALAENTAQRNARDAADKAVRDRERDLAVRRRASDAAAAALRDWQDRWQTALAGTWFSDHGSSAGAIREALDVLADLPAELRDRAGLRHRIGAMERDRNAFVANIIALYADLEEELGPNTVLQSAKSIGQRHEQAKQSLERRRQKEADLAGLAAEREKLAAEVAVHEGRKKQLLQFFDVESLAEVGNAIGRCAARDRLEEGQKDLGLQIARELQAPSLGEALGQLGGTDLPVVERDCAELATRLEDLDERVKVLFAEKLRASDRLNEIGGDDAVARIEAERRTVLLEIQDMAVRFLRLKTGGLLAEHAIRAFRESHRSSMMQHASEAFRLITRDEYSGLAARPEKDREVLIGLSRHGGSKLAGDLSKGTRFQLYLALRLAGYEEFAAVRPPVPFIADDIMETFDEPRSEEVFRLFAQMGTIGQVIYLTHHRHLCDIAKQVVPAVRVHEVAV